MNKTPRILIVDDEPLSVALFSDMLRSDHYEILNATDGFGAVEQAQMELPDLIVLDWDMPGLDGLKVLKQLKQNEKTRDIQVIMITGIMTSAENLKSAMDGGAIYFLRKPFEQVEFVARVQSAVKLSNAIRELDHDNRVIQNRNLFIHSLIESIPHALVYYSLEGMILGCNSQFEELIGKPERDLKDKLVYMQCSEESTAMHLQSDMEIRRCRKGKSYEGTLGPEGKEYIFSKNLFFNIGGEPEGILCLLTDISATKNMHRQIMDIKKKELVSSALRLIQISEMNNSLISELATLNQFVNKEGGLVINQMITRYAIASDERTWGDFISRFENVYEVFYKRLQERFPDLTPGEQRLCALLRLNVSTKDISAITFQNPQSIDTARYRLRKKLKLESEENLVDFLLRLDS